MIAERERMTLRLISLSLAGAGAHQLELQTRGFFVPEQGRGSLRTLAAGTNEDGGGKTGDYLRDRRGEEISRL